jgi:hypothetical protein
LRDQKVSRECVRLLLLPTHRTVPFEEDGPFFVEQDVTCFMEEREPQLVVGLVPQAELE